MPMTCDTCNMPIEGKSINAMGKSYHPEHFVCSVCKKPITDDTFHQLDGKPICHVDYEATCPTCATCQKPITDRCVTAMGKKFHELHFVCKMCEMSLVGTEYHERDGNPICHKCFITKLADKCKSCGEAISACATVALNAKWHPDCFKCKKCDQVIKSPTFKVDPASGYPICEKC